jgi:hypothetical protein
VKVLPTLFDEFQAMSDVVLNVYDLHPQNEGLYHVGLGFYHSGVVINGQEWTFASGAGVHATSPQSVPGFRESIHLGKFKGTMRDVDTILDSLRPNYHGGNYHILDRNCNSFAESFVFKLLNKEVPAYVNRMAFWGSLFSCLLPQEMTGQAPVGDTSSSSSSSSSGGGAYVPASRRGRSAMPQQGLNPIASGGGGGGGGASQAEREARREQMLAAASQRLGS